MTEILSTTLWDAVRKKQESVSIIDGLIYENNNLIVSESDDFRTRFILQMMLDMVNLNCNSFFNNFTIRKRNGRYPVLFINSENSIKDIKNMLRDISYGMENNHVIEMLNHIHFIDCFGLYNLHSNIIDLRNLLRGLIEQEGISLIVIDSFSGLIKHEESNVSVKEALHDLHEITLFAQQYGLPLIFTNKIVVKNPDLDDVLRSSIAFTNWTDNIIWLKKTGNDSCSLKKIKSGNEFLTDDSEIRIKFNGKRLHEIHN